jgi:hypothetical protein
MPSGTPVKVRTRLIGSTPLMMHNVQLADPDNHWTKEIAKITKKRVKTEEDRREIARLEFLGGLYVHENRIVIPKMNVRRCFQEAAKATRKGKDIVRAVNLAQPAEANATLAFPDEGKNPDQLYALVGADGVTPLYRDVTMVTVRGRTPRTRPVFKTWGLTVEWLLLTNLLDYEEFAEIVKVSGLIEGLGDNRVNGAGRFTVDIDQL